MPFHVLKREKLKRTVIKMKERCITQGYNNSGSGTLVTPHIQREFTKYRRCLQPCNLASWNFSNTEPVKNIHSSMKNTWILENNAYCLLTLIFGHKIASTSSLDTKKNSMIRRQSTFSHYQNGRLFSFSTFGRKKSWIMLARLYARLETTYFLCPHKRSTIFPVNNSFMTSWPS